MTFLEFLYKKYPLYEGRILSEFNISVQRMVELVDEWSKGE